MAYMSQERKAELAPAIKAVLKKYRVKGTIAVRNHSTLVINIKSGALNFIDNFNATTQAQPRYDGARMAEGSLDVNPYWYQEHFTGNCKKFFTEMFAACNKGNHDRSDIQTDYFDVGWYVDMNVGAWNRPYIVE